MRRRSRSVRLVVLALAGGLVTAGAVTSPAHAATTQASTTQASITQASITQASITQASITQASAAPVVRPIAAGAGKGHILGAALQDLPALGYTEQEFSLSGTADTFQQSGTWSSDGRWNVAVSGSEPYRTRMIVRRPVNPARFNGTVVVEWLNVSFGVDIDVDWSQSWTQFTRAGYAYVGVTAQKVGSDFLTKFDPKRYAGVSIKDDDASYSIFSQAAAAVRSGQVLGGLKPVRLLASGHSQSALRLVTYINAVQPRDRMFNGFLVHGRGASGAGINSNLLASTPSPSFIRSDLGVPVLQLQSETDILSSASARQPDTSALRTWEVAGTAHADAYGLAQYNPQNAISHAVNDGAPITCATPVNSAPFRYAENAAFAALDRWVAAGVAPAKFAPIKNILTFSVTDQNGNAEGGLRLPDVDVPVAVYGALGSGGQGLLGSSACTLLGTTKAFDAARLRSLYPSHASYVARYTAAAKAARKAGALLPADYTLAVASAQRARVPA